MSWHQSRHVGTDGENVLRRGGGGRRGLKSWGCRHIWACITIDCRRSRGIEGERGEKLSAVCPADSSGSIEANPPRSPYTHTHTHTHTHTPLKLLSQCDLNEIQRVTLVLRSMQSRPPSTPLGDPMEIRETALGLHLNCSESEQIILTLLSSPSTWLIKNLTCCWCG